LLRPGSFQVLTTTTTDIPFEEAAHTKERGAKLMLDSSLALLMRGRKEGGGGMETKGSQGKLWGNFMLFFS